MRTMVTGLDPSDRNFAVIGHETVTINIIRIPIIIIVLTWFAIEFGLIDPHVGLKILMQVIHSKVINSHDHLRLSDFDSPGIESVHVAAFRPLGLAPGVLIMPLLR